MANQTSLFQRRIRGGVAVMLFAFIILAVRLVDVTLFSAPPPVAKAAPRAQVVRADLLDRNGDIVARNLPAYDLYARPKLLKDKRAAAIALAAASGTDPARLMTILNGKSPIVLVARRLPSKTRDQIAALKLAGVEFTPGSKRDYPYGRLAAQAVGVTDIDGKGVSGLEMGLNRRITTDRAPITSSLDMRVQFILAHEAQAAMDEFRTLSAGGLVMDVNTGEILAMVSLPDFDPNTRQFKGRDSQRNIMVQDIYELGSVFKIFSFALAMQDHTVRLDEQLPIGRGFEIGRFTIREAEAMPATLAARDVLAESSNIGTAQIALRSGGERQRAFLDSLGLLSPREIELAERRRPQFPSRWGQVETATIGFGHGISVSPLSFATAAAMMVNGGRWISPTLLKRPADSRGEQVIAPETSDVMRRLLRYVVTDGTGKKADIPGYDVGGKTGSAEKAGRHGYQEHKLVTSFCGIFPADNPRYLVFVMLDEPHPTATIRRALAGNTAAPFAGRVIQWIAPLLGVPLRLDAAAPDLPPPNTAAKENHNANG